MEIYDKIQFEDGEQEQRILELETFHLAPTGFRFIDDHYGFRRSCRHVLMGTAGTGKSTLVRSLMLRVAEKHKVLLYSSEESVEQLKDMFALRRTPNDVLKNLELLHEDEVFEGKTKRDPQDLIHALKVRIFNTKADIVFFDNLTTSSYYDGQPYAQQIELLDGLALVMKKFSVPLVIVAHTKKGIKDDQQSLVTPDDIRGPAYLVNKAEFLYVYQKFVLDTIMASQIGTVRIKKARGSRTIENIYDLAYSSERLEYSCDSKLDFKVFNEYYQKRRKLKK